MLALVEVLQLAACAGGLDAAQLRMLKAQVTTPKAQTSGPPANMSTDQGVRDRSLRPHRKGAAQGRNRTHDTPTFRRQT
jgi:hypothetical protein